MRRKEAGLSLAELTVVLAVLAIGGAVSLPPLFRTSAALRVRLAASELSSILRLSHSFAIRHGLNVAVKFRTAESGVVTYALYRDGDGDGVRNADIDSGVDPQVAPAQRLAHLGRQVRFGFPPGIAPRDPGDPRHRLDRLDDPIRFNRSDLASFSPIGGSTPGSLYLTDSQSRLAAVRVFGRTGKIKILTYDPLKEVWK